MADFIEDDDTYLSGEEDYVYKTDLDYEEDDDEVS